MDTLIIGGGASGFAAAIAASDAGQRVTILERAQKPLRKLLASGNGRGNLLNRGELHYSGDAQILNAVFSAVPPIEVEQFWRTLGVPLCQEAEGRVYPSIRLAQAACDAMLFAAKCRSITVRCDCEVSAIRPMPDGSFEIVSRETLRRPLTGKQGAKGKTEIIGRKERIDHANRVILCAGGSASPQLGTDGASERLLAALKHTLVPSRPSLCPLVTRDPLPDALIGLRLRASVALFDNGDHPLSQAYRGEILFAKDGVSGIAAMQLSRDVPVTGECNIHIDLREALGFEGMTKEEVQGVLQGLVKTYASLPAHALLTGRLPYPAAAALLPLIGLDPLMPCKQMKDSSLKALSQSIVSLSLPVAGTRGFEQAQTTAGGLPESELRLSALESKRVKGLYIAGEALDVDGDCGGFNLMFAVASGLMVGKGGAV